MRMSISVQHVQKIAQLACIQIHDLELPQFGDQLNGILTWIDQIQSIDVSSLDLRELTERESIREREDQVTAPNRLAEIMRNAPAERLGLFEVPKMVE
jgi:aspartyl-tRNA(Asn)/glutamyl-tRNA(Gln) amidotransferase subunit C